MTDPGEAMPRRPPRAPMPRRARRRWAVAAGVAACCAMALAVTGSATASAALLLFVAALGTGCVLALRAMGVSAAHPWVQRMRSRPWRDGQDVLQLGLRHLPDLDERWFVEAIGPDFRPIDVVSIGPATVLLHPAPPA